MDGKTAYEVSKEGYSKHLTQQWTWFTDWINGKNNDHTKATDIKTYSPLKYGLFYSNVGEDVQKNDMFENITYYKIQQEEEKKLKELDEAEEKQEQVIEQKFNDTNQESNNKNLFKIIISGIIAIILLIIVLKKKTKKC